MGWPIVDRETEVSGADGDRKIKIPLSADQPYPVDSYSATSDFYTYIYICRYFQHA